MTMFRTLRITALAAILSTAGWAAQAAEMVVGFIAELTGPIADYGKNVARGIQLGAEFLNASKDLNGHTIKLLTEDDGSDKGQALTLLEKFILRDKADVVIGTSSSVFAAAIAPRAEELKVPMITIAYATAPVQGRQWVFKATDTIPRQFQAIANYTANVIKPKTCVRVWVRDNEGYVQNAKVWGDIVSAGGVKIIDDVTVLLADTDFTAAATKIVSLKPDCLYLAMAPEGAANFILQLRSAGLDPATKVTGGSTMSTQFFLKAAGAAAEGVYTFAEYSPGGVNELGKRFESLYVAKYGDKPDSFSAAGFSEMLMIGTAIKNAGASPTRQSIRDAMAAIKDMNTVVGRGKLSMAGQIAQYEMTVLTVKGGQIIVAP
jgi:branched-chain amino acid transport system substrate-binding protein